MKTSAGTMRFDDLPQTYEELAALHMPRPIRDKIELENVIEIVDLMAGHDLTNDQEDYIEILSDLIEKYEDENDPLQDDATPVEALKMLMEENGLHASDIGRLLGDRALGSRILTGERQLSKAHIRILSERFKVTPSLFL